MGYYMTHQKMITSEDYCRLLRMILAERDKNYSLHQLRRMLSRANIVFSDLIPPDVVTMNTRVRLKDLRYKESQTVTLTYDKEPKPNSTDGPGRVPILSPLGLSLLGQKIGDVVIRRILIEEMLYQPESNCRKIG